MKNKKYFSVHLSLLLVLLTCGIYSQKITSSFKKISNYSCKAKQKNVFIFSDTDSLSFKYKTLGTIEASGKAGDNDLEIIDRLKYTAYQNCANAIIGVKTETVNKNYGNDFRTDARTYVCKIFRGTAVRIEPDSLYRSNIFGNHQDISFIKNTINYNHAQESKTQLAVFLSALVAILLVGIYVVTAYY